MGHATHMQIGEALREARLKKGLRQSDVAAALPHRVHPKTVGKWERGLAVPRGQLPHLEQLLGLRLTSNEAPTPATGDISTMSDAELVNLLMRGLAEMARRLPAGAEPAAPIDAATILEQGWTVTRRSDTRSMGDNSATAK